MIRNFRNIASAILLSLCLGLLVSCQSSGISDDSVPSPTSDSESISADQQLLYQSSNVAVALIDDTNKNSHTIFEWATLTEEEAYTKNTVVITGTASNVRQAVVSYEYMDTSVSDNITIFDIQVSDVLACRSGSLEQGDLVTVGIGYNTDQYEEDLALIQEGESYLMFCYVAADQEDDPLELAEYVDYWICAPKDLFLEKVGDFYLSIDDFFSDVSGSLALVDDLHLTEEQIDALSEISADDVDAATAYIEKEFTDEPEALADALLVLKKRTEVNPGALWSLVNRSHLIECGKLEEYVRNTALAYAN